jgi:putative oxygen-independent coproporphyrinogen III oxidase
VTTGAGPFGVYVHIPFCAQRCDYCAFATWTDRSELAESYAAAVVTEISRAVAAGIPTATSVFFGGGTPSMLDDDLLMAILDAVPTSADAEITVECNPDTITVDKLRHYRRGGVNRLSFGVQSMVAHVLQSLGRTHDPDNVRSAVEAARTAGFERYNLDLIYGAVGESMDDWTGSVRAALALEPTHISAYGLTVEAGTPLADDASRHPDDDDQADKYVVADELLAQAGLPWYEISNFARPGHECRHNLLYWSQGDYRGFGCAAHSHQQGRRWWNLRTPERYIDAVRSASSAEGGHELLADDVRRVEGLQLALRTRDGVPSDALAEALRDPNFDGLMEVSAGSARLTVPGRLLANEVALRLG